MKKLITTKITLLSLVLIAALSFTACNDVASPYGSDAELISDSISQDAFKKGNGNGNGNQPYGDAVVDRKVYVCKFVSTPDVNERLKRGNKGLVHVNANSLRNVLPGFPEVSIGDEWTDRHGLSRVIDPLVGAAALNGDDVDVEDACSGDDITGGGGTVIIIDGEGW